MLLAHGVCCCSYVGAIYLCEEPSPKLVALSADYAKSHMQSSADGRYGGHNLNLLNQNLGDSGLAYIYSIL